MTVLSTYLVVNAKYVLHLACCCNFITLQWALFREWKAKRVLLYLIQIVAAVTTALTAPTSPTDIYLALTGLIDLQTRGFILLESDASQHYQLQE